MQPPPIWVPDYDWAAVTPISSRLGINVYFSDTVINVCAEDECFYYRQIQQALSTQALETIGHLSLTFNPFFQQLVIHKVALIRDGEQIWCSQLEHFEILRREKDIERRVFDGCLTASLIIPGVRIGDIVDYSYSIIGSQPILRGSVDIKTRFSWGLCAARQRLLVIFPKNKEVVMQLNNGAIEPQKFDDGDTRSFLWELKNTELEKFETAMPPGYDPSPYVTISDARSWSEIADIFRPVYQTDQALPKSLLESADKAKSGTRDDQEVVLALLRFVQREVRYLAVSIGDGGLIPRKIDEIWTSRYGDCKDKSLLLACLLRHYNIDSSPALVNTVTREFVDEAAAHVYAFNHCIVRVKLNEEIRYFDPTFPEQAGLWQTITPPYYGKALPLVEDSQIEKIDVSAQKHVVEAVENWKIEGLVNPKVFVEIRTYWRDYMADSARTKLRSDGLNVLADEYADFYDRQYRGTKRTKDTQIIDRPDNNELEIIESYELTNPFTISGSGGKFLNFVWRPEELMPDFMVTQTNERDTPIDLGVARRKSRTAIFALPKEHFATARNDKIVSDGWKMECDWSIVTPFILKIHNDFTCESKIIQPAHAKEFFEALAKSDSLTGFSYSMPIYTSKTQSWFEENWFKIIWPILVLAYIVAAVYTGN